MHFFQVKEYCPLVFRNLRERFGIEDAQYLNSLTKAPKPMDVDLPGRSTGSKFYASQDRLYVIKTLTSEEVEQMHSLLKHYHPFVVERHGKHQLNNHEIFPNLSATRKSRNHSNSFFAGKTLLPQYLGMYRLTVDNVEHYLVVMRNMFSNHLKIHTKYNLKGSTVDREASQKEREKDHPTFKDNDFLNDDMKIQIGDEAKVKVMETLEADVGFLSKIHVMDYSLLLGVHNLKQAEMDNPQEADEEDGKE